ncbi:MAG TPA: 30S ribosomal protein S15, partial [Candidatus Angelobacter sp.]|nr:30S ribosomal protein S15 [Candidatus Angelobacter sp.]
MAEETEVKSKVIAEYRRAEKDTGSPEVQIALSTTRIRELTE